MSSEIGYENQQSSSGSRAPWKIYTSSNVDPASWKAGGTTSYSSSPSSSMNAVSFGFVATAILIALFLIMAILEHLFRPTATAAATTPSNDQSNNTESGSKLRVHQQNETTSYGGGVSVLMPGEKYPTCIAKLAPLPSPTQPLRCPSNYINQHAFAFS
ncbi:hypothetical protein V2J09_021435 [Rumex salicifolius]